MLEKAFPIDFVRQVLEQTLLEEHIKKPKEYFGGQDQVNLFSFYEQLQKESEVNRFTEIYRDLVDQQNRTGLIMNGTLVAPENPTITNLNQCTIIPMSFTCSFRVKLGDRDSTINTINNLIKTLKGRKQDIAMLDNGSLFKVGTLGNNINGKPKISQGDYIGDFENITINKTWVEDSGSETVMKSQFITPEVGFPHFTKTILLVSAMPPMEVEVTTLTITPHPTNYRVSYEVSGTGLTIKIQVIGGELIDDDITLAYAYKYVTNRTQNVRTKIANLVSQGFENNTTVDSYLYCKIGNKLCTIQRDLQGFWEEIIDDSEHKDIPFPSDHNSFEKFKLSMSFDSIRCDEPRNLDANEYCVISFGGSATLVNESVLVGNELTKLGIVKKSIKADTPIDFTSQTIAWLEPLEMPSGNNADTKLNQLISNNFVNNSHTNSLSISLQYTFIVDKNIEFLKQAFKYGRYGIQGTLANNYNDGISPNIIYEIKEIWSAWGEVDIVQFIAKIIESVDIENTESDTLSITIPFQVQGENN